MNYFIIVFFVLSSIFYSFFLSGGDEALMSVNIEQSFVKRNSQLIRNLVLAVGGGSLLICPRTKILSNLIDFSAGQSIVMDLFGVGFMATAINRAVLEGCKIELNSNVSLASGVASGLTAMVLQMESLGFDLSNPSTQKHSFLASLFIGKLIIMAELMYGCRMNQKTIGNKSQQLLDKNKEYTLLQEELKLVQEKFNVASFFAINNMLQLRCMRTEHERNIKTLKVKLGQRNMIILYIYFYLNRVGREKTQMEKQHRTDMELALEEHRTDMELALEEHKKRTAQIKDKLEEVIEEKSKEQKKCFTAFATLLNIFNVLEETFRKTKEENREAISKLSNELEALKTEYEIIKETTSHKKELSNLDNNLFVECRRLERQLLEIKDQLKRTSLENKELRTLKQPLVGKIHDLERQNYKLTKEIHELQLKHSELLALEKELNNRIWHLEGKLDDLKYDDIGDENGTN